MAAIEQALRQDPHNPRYLLQYARCLGAVARIAEARASADRAMQAAANDAALCDAIGTFYSSIGEQLRAVDAYSRAIALNPQRGVYWFNRAAVLRFLGQLEKAEQDYDQAIRLQPIDCEAYLNRAELRTQTLERNHVEALERVMAAGNMPWLGEVQIRYALAKEYEDMGRYQESWSHLVSGARLRRAHLQYDVQRDVETVQWIKDAYPTVGCEPAADAPGPAGPAGPPGPPGPPGPRPIFIVGLPRSGSTLVERILGNHPGVFAAGELNHFAAVLTQAAQHGNAGRALPRQHLIEATRALDFAALGAAYLARVRSVAFAQGHFTDKMPLNYLYCGLIRMALPQARIVHVTRHPMASCYAMFKTLFRDGYPFSYDLAELAQFHGGYQRLMRHWHQSMPGVIHDISYERLVQDQEGETRRLLDACGLPWHDACLSFHTNPTATRTASASQVRRPIYASSLTQWRHYESQLEGLRSQLLAAGVDAQELA
jgi:tetratricopeptide (TPR) repeat protein